MLYLSKRRYDILTSNDVKLATDEEIKLFVKYFNNEELSQRCEEVSKLYEIERKINSLLLTNDERLFYKDRQILQDFEDELDYIYDVTNHLTEDEITELVKITTKKWYTEYKFLRNKYYCLKLASFKDEETYIFELYNITYLQMIQDSEIFKKISNKSKLHLLKNSSSKRKVKPNKSKDKDSDNEQKAVGC
jgi:hypothetical protein